MNKANLAGNFTFPGTAKTVKRVGYGAMQLAGQGVFGPPKDWDAAISVLHEAVGLGIDHIDTSDYYGPHITNQIIQQALAPYPEDLTIVTKVGARRDDKGAWLSALSADELKSAVEDNLENLGLEKLDVVNLRLWGKDGVSGPDEGSVEKPLATLVKLKEQGLIGAIGMSNTTAKQVAEARTITEVACVQNQYNLAHRNDDSLIDELASQNIAYVPFFPLGGFSPLQSSKLNAVAESLNATPMQVALAWLLQRSPNILLIPGTSSVEHLRENVKAAELEIPIEMINKLNSIDSENN